MSAPRTLDKLDAKKILIGTFIAAIGGAGGYLTKEIGNIDWGQWTIVVVPAWSILCNIIIKWWRDNQ